MSVLSHHRWLTAPPLADVGRAAAHVQDLACGELLRLIAQLSRALGLDLSRTASRVREVGAMPRISPAFCLRYWQLREAAGRRDIDAVVDVLHAINQWTPASMAVGGDIAVSSVLSEEWERPLVEEYRAMRFGDSRHLRVVVRPVLTAQLDEEREHIGRALQALAAVDAVHAAEVRHHVRHVKLFVGAASPGGSSIKAPGALLMVRPDPRRVDPVVHYLDWLVHEGAHMHLNMLMWLDPIVLNEDHRAYDSPLRPDRRSMHATLHAVFVLYRLVRVLQRLSERTDPLLDPQAVRARLARHRADFLAGCRVVEQHAAFSEAGRRWFAPVARQARLLQETPHHGASHVHRCN